MHVDELFNQYFPQQNEGFDLEAEVSSKQKTRTKNYQYCTEKQPKHCVEQILDKILSNVIFSSMKRKFVAKRRRDLDTEDNVNNNCDVLEETEDFNLQMSGKRKRRKTENLGKNFTSLHRNCLVCGRIVAPKFLHNKNWPTLMILIIFG